MVARTKIPPTTNGEGKIKIHAPKKLDIACGQNKQPGYKGIDIAGDADILHDLNETPWPIKTSSVEEAFCSHYVEHIPHWRPGWEQDGWFRFFDELHRVMKPEGMVQIHCPHMRNDRAFWDPTHVRFVHETSFFYLSKDWRDIQGLSHYPVKCNFEFVTGNLDLLGDLPSKNHEHQNFARTHYWNAMGDLMVILKARKE